MKIFIIFIFWFLIAMLGFGSLQSQNIGLILFFAIAFIMLTILLLISIIDFIKGEMNDSTSHKNNYEEINGVEQEVHFRDNTTEHITINHPEYIGLLTKIDKKKIAEEYLESLKKEKNHGKNK
ncbi:MAG TPA: hypothetical protein VLF89_05995 [Candidatus Saccharimonadales bacterium]|nr:hypothetical protein [Candidatus Saccharimonadales bacterium]